MYVTSTYLLFSVLTFVQVDFVPTHIKRITEDGIELVDGTQHKIDILVCATGENVACIWM